MHLASLLVTLLLGALAIVLSIPITVLWVECLLALLPSLQKPSEAGFDSLPTIAVLIPAHNEALGIASTLQNLRPQLSAHDRLVVIADNCEDETAAIARSTGAIVTERHNRAQRGKGYALQHGLQWLTAQPPDVVVIVDADCRMAPGGIARMAQQVIATNRPVQAKYLMAPPTQPSPKDHLSALAFTVKNWVRPQGLQRLGLPCLLTGTGMGFPWLALRQVSLGGDNLVEDMQLGLDLAIAGYPPQFCPQVSVTSILPQQERAATSQRTRWEHGHLQTIRYQMPRLLREAWRQRRLDLLALALELGVPPLSMLVLLWLGCSVLAIGAWVFGMSGWPALGLMVAGAMLTIALLVAWLGFARDQVSLTLLLTIPLYLLWKIPLYVTFLIRPQSHWVRTERDTPAPAPQDPSE